MLELSGQKKPAGQLIGIGVFGGQKYLFGHIFIEDIPFEGQYRPPRQGIGITVPAGQ